MRNAPPHFGVLPACHKSWRAKTRLSRFAFGGWCRCEPRRHAQATAAEQRQVRVAAVWRPPPHGNLRRRVTLPHLADQPLSNPLHVPAMFSRSRARGEASNASGGGGEARAAHMPAAAGHTDANRRSPRPERTEQTRRRRRGGSSARERNAEQQSSGASSDSSGPESDRSTDESDSSAGGGRCGLPCPISCRNAIARPVI